MFWLLLSCLEAGQTKMANSRQSHSDGAPHVDLVTSIDPAQGWGGLRVPGPSLTCLQHPIRSLGDKIGVPTFPRTLIGFKLWNELDKSVKGENHVNKHWAVTSPHKDKEARSSRESGTDLLGTPDCLAPVSLPATPFTSLSQRQ